MTQEDDERIRKALITFFNRFIGMLITDIVISVTMTKMLITYG